MDSILPLGRRSLLAEMERPFTYIYGMDTKVHRFGLARLGSFQLRWCRHGVVIKWGCFGREEPKPELNQNSVNGIRQGGVLVEEVALTTMAMHWNPTVEIGKEKESSLEEEEGSNLREG